MVKNRKTFVYFFDRLTNKKVIPHLILLDLPLPKKPNEVLRYKEQHRFKHIR
jgi:hypothetical protein